MSVLDGPGEGTWSVFAMKVVEERDELRYKLAGEAAHIKSLENLLVDACRERDEARAALTKVEAERDEAVKLSLKLARELENKRAKEAELVRSLDRGGRR